LGTDSDDYSDEVTVDSSDNIYVTGYTSGGLDNNTNSGGQDIFLVKYNSSGTKQWTQQLGTSGVEVDNYSNIYVTGYAGSYDIILVKYNSDGVLQ
jgi:hypothetical protein